MEKLRNGVTAVFSACFSLVVLPLYIYLTESKINGFFSIAILILTTSFFALINYFFVPNLLYKFRFVRRLVDPLARYEGFWIHYIFPEDEHDERACGIISFSYDKFEHTYLFSGENYSSEGKVISSFQVRDIQFDKNINGFRYWGSVKQQENAAFSCYGELSFVETGGKLIQSANGMFINNSKKLVRAKYSTERILNEKSSPYKLPKELGFAISIRAKWASNKYKENILTRCNETDT